PPLRAGVPWPGAALVVARYLVDGQLDPSFGTRGEVTMRMSLRSSFGHAVAIQPDGKIVISGAVLDSGDFRPLLARFNADGTPDQDFGANGVVVSDAYGFFDQLALGPDGGIIAATENRRLFRYDAA